MVRTFVLHEGVCPATRTLAPNSGGRTPGSKLPASPPPLLRPDGGGQPRSCTCVQGSKNYVETSTCRCTTTGMSSSLSKNCFCTSGPEHQTGTTTGMPTSLSKKSGPVEHHEDELRGGCGGCGCGGCGCGGCVWLYLVVIGGRGGGGYTAPRHKQSTDEG